jgi:hypothetical protein
VKYYNADQIEDDEMARHVVCMGEERNVKFWYKNLCIYGRITLK